MLASKCRLFTDIDTSFVPIGRILRDNRSGAIIAPAPLFDHGLSLFNCAMRDDIDNLDEYAKTRCPAYAGVTFESICSETMGKTQAAQLGKLIGFKFKRYPAINWPEERLTAIERHTQKRVHQLLGLERQTGGMERQRRNQKLD
jgi:hypothetical protein